MILHFLSSLLFIYCNNTKIIKNERYFVDKILGKRLKNGISTCAKPFCKK